MNIRPDTWMPMFWGDYARDTAHLDATMHGAYLMLIKHYWCTGGPLPDDDAQLWRVACCNSLPAWKKIRPIIERFFTVADGMWTHKRIDAEMANARRMVEQRSNAGRASAQARAQRAFNERSTSVATSDGTDVEQANQRNARPSPSPSPSPSVPNGTAPPLDLKEAVFGHCLGVLAAKTGRAPATLRSLVGKWCRDFSEGAVIEAIAAMQREGPIDPIPWLEKALARRSESTRPKVVRSF